MMADENLVERRVQIVEGRLKRVEEDQVDLRRHMDVLTEKVHTVHLDLVKGNSLTEATRDSVIRIEQNTSASFERIEKHTAKSLDDINARIKDAVDAATAARMLSRTPVWSLVWGFVAAVATGLGIVVAYFKL